MAGLVYPWQGSGPAEILEHRALHPVAACSSARMDSSAAPRRVEAHPAEQVARLQDRAALLLGAAHLRLGTVAAGLSTPDTAAGATLLLVQVEAWAGQRATARAPASSQAASDAAPEHRPLDSSAPDVSMRQQGGACKQLARSHIQCRNVSQNPKSKSCGSHDAHGRGNRRLTSGRGTLGDFASVTVHDGSPFSS